MKSENNEDIGTSLGVIDRLNADSFAGDEPGRLQALAKARALCSRLETPWESLTRMIWQEVRCSKYSPRQVCQMRFHLTCIP